MAAAGRRYACCAFADGFAVLVDLHRHLNRGHAPMHAKNLTVTMSSHVVDGEVDGEEVLDEVAGGVDVARQVASDEDADGAPARMEELVLADGFKLLRGRECVRACEMRLCAPS